jgi:hypothetical protein
MSAAAARQLVSFRSIAKFSSNGNHYTTQIDRMLPKKLLGELTV